MEKKTNIVQDFLAAFLVPTIINKGLMLYFGLNYSAHPDEGYGYGLIATLVFFVLSMAGFLWKYKDIEDP